MWGKNNIKGVDGNIYNPTKMKIHNSISKNNQTNRGWRKRKKTKPKTEREKEKTSKERERENREGQRK